MPADTGRYRIPEGGGIWARNIQAPLDMAA